MYKGLCKKLKRIYQQHDSAPLAAGELITAKGSPTVLF